MKDFIFGTLATEELRIQHVRSRRAGVSHLFDRSPRDPLPGQPIILNLAIGPDHPCDSAWVYWSNDDTDPAGKDGVASHGKSLAMMPAGVEWDTVLWGYIKTFSAELPGQPADSILRYTLSGITSSGEEIFADEGRIYACYIADDPTPAWTQDAIIYQIFVDRFFPGNGKNWLNPSTPMGFYGGTLSGILQKMDYLSDLGVNVLWLTPIFPSPSHHGYDATDLFEIESRLGSKQDLHRLLDEAHRNGMRVLLDLVPNHVSNLHPTFQSAISDPNSPYQSWYTFSHWPNKYQAFFDVPELPQLNLRNPAARQHMLDAAEYWLSFGVDGYRVDYAIGPAMDFWADFRRTTRQARPDCWTFGEVVEPPDTQLNFSGGLDGCLDFNLMEALRKAFAYSDWKADQLASFLTRHEAYFPETFSRPSFLDNHDMNRFLWAAGGDQKRLRLAALSQFTLAGPPIIYYGTEVGLSQVRDVRQDGRGLPEESRLPMPWGEEQDYNLLGYYQQLVQLRKATPEFRHGCLRLVSSRENVLLYTRGDQNSLVVALNLSDKVCTVKLEGGFTRVLIQTNPGDLSIDGSALKMAPFGGAVLARV